MRKNSAYAKSKKRLVLAAGIFVILVSMFVGSMFSDWAQIMSNNKNAEQLSKEYEKLKEESSSLQSEVNKLQDPEYLARYAREKFLYSKDGELILRIPSINEE